MTDVPPLAKVDLGGPPWERTLVRRIRELHLAWRTEKTYRHWAWRCIRFCQPAPGVPLSDEDLRRWLSHLVVNERVSAATQKQALNAAVFLSREVFKREPGDFSQFVHAKRRRTVPTVLTREECTRLFAELAGTTRLMAELMYGAGLRLTEMLRLRVKDVDMSRLQLAVPGRQRQQRTPDHGAALFAGLPAPASEPASATCRTCSAMQISQRRKSTCTPPSKRASASAARWMTE